MNKYIVGLLIGFLIGTAALVATTRVVLQQQKAEKTFHEHANFAVFLNGTRFDFAKIQYMNTTPCTAGIPVLVPVAQAHGDVNDLRDAVHLHDQNGGVVHVHRAGITWHNFFETLEMTFEKGTFTDDTGKKYENNDQNSFRYFVNGKEETDITNREIRDLDSVLITYGRKNRPQTSIQQELGQIPNDACVSSGLCNSRGPAPVETCGGHATNPSWLEQLLGVN